MPKLCSRGNFSDYAITYQILKPNNNVATLVTLHHMSDLLSFIIFCKLIIWHFDLFSNPPIVSQAPAQSNQTSQLPPLTTSTGKLDLANVMKLCGIMDDDDFMDTDEAQPSAPLPPPPQSTTPYDMPTSLNTTQPSDIMVTIPYVQNSDMSHNRVSKRKYQIQFTCNLEIATYLHDI